jgi:hypothetical protein
MGKCSFKTTPVMEKRVLILIIAVALLAVAIIARYIAQTRLVKTPKGSEPNVRTPQNPSKETEEKSLPTLGRLVPFSFRPRAFAFREQSPAVSNHLLKKKAYYRKHGKDRR